MSRSRNLREIGRSEGRTVPFAPANDMPHLVCPQRDTVSGSVALHRLTVFERSGDGQGAVRGVLVDRQLAARCVDRRGLDPVVDRVGVQ